MPVAFGEATKTVPVVQDGAKSYRFRVRWGEESATDDAEGEIVARSDRRPAPAEIENLLPRFVGVILQTPPTFSAIRIAGARAYDLAREGETFAIEPRPIHVYRLALISAEPDAAVLEAECGKGAYVRAIARDLGRALGCYGHVIELRRTRVGPFSVEAAIPLDRLPEDADLMARAILPLQAGLAEIPALPVDRSARCDPSARSEAAASRSPLRSRGGLTPNASERRSPSASSRTAISSRPGCSICADRFFAYFHASNAFSSIACPSGDFWNTTLAIRLSLSKSGKSNQDRVFIRSRLRAVSVSPLASAMRK